MTRTECKVLAATTRLPIRPHRQNARSNWDVSVPEGPHTFASPIVEAYVMRHLTNPGFHEPSEDKEPASFQHTADMKEWEESVQHLLERGIDRKSVV